MESTLAALVDRLDGKEDVLRAPSTDLDAPPHGADVISSAGQDQAPMLLIRDAATDAGAHSPEISVTSGNFSDVISDGLITLTTAHSLLSLSVPPSL